MDPKFVRVASSHDIPPGTGKMVMAQEKPMALFNVEGSFYAINQVCAHMGGPLSEGRLEGKVVTCPWHGWSYFVDTGLADHEGGHSVASYEVKVEGDDIFVGWLESI